MTVIWVRVTIKMLLNNVHFLHCDPDNRYQFSHNRTSLSKDNCHLTEMLAKFTEIEHLGEVYTCDTCNSKRRSSSTKPVLRTEATKRLLVTKLPRVVRLHLKRFR